MLELDFVLKVNTAATRHLVSCEDEQGDIDFGQAWLDWKPIFNKILKDELSKRRMDAVRIPEEVAPPPLAEPKKDVAKSKVSTDVKEEAEEEEEEVEKPKSKRVLTLKDKLKKRLKEAKAKKKKK